VFHFQPDQIWNMPGDELEFWADQAEQILKAEAAAAKGSGG